MHNKETDKSKKKKKRKECIEIQNKDERKQKNVADYRQRECNAMKIEIELVFVDDCKSALAVYS